MKSCLKKFIACLSALSFEVLFTFSINSPANESVRERDFKMANVFPEYRDY